MKRTIYGNLLKWKDITCRKPLILYWVRQVCKTCILKQELVVAISNLDRVTMQLLSKECTERQRQYFFIGGMPKSVFTWLQTLNPKTVGKVVQTIEKIPPVEVKVEEKSKSLLFFINKDFKTLKFKGLRLSSKPYIGKVGWGIIRFMRLKHILIEKKNTLYLFNL